MPGRDPCDGAAEVAARARRREPRRRPPSPDGM
jgi:hypothetical protein